MDGALEAEILDELDRRQRRVRAVLGKRADELLASPPDLRMIDLLAVK